MILKNSRHEHFAQLVAKGVNQTEAARTAGFSEKTAKVQASRLLTRVNVRNRVEELRNRVSEQAISTSGITKAWVMSKLKENAEKGMAEGQRTPAIRALELMGKELGMFVDRKEIGLGKLREMTTEDLMRLLVEIEGEIQPSAVH